MSKKRTLIERIIYKISLFLFKKNHVLKKCATEALMRFLSGLNILNGLLKFHDCNIIDIMTPRTQICAVNINSSKHEVIKKLKDTCHTKILIY